MSESHTAHLRLLPKQARFIRCRARVIMLVKIYLDIAVFCVDNKQHGKGRSNDE